MIGILRQLLLRQDRMRFQFILFAAIAFFLSAIGGRGINAQTGKEFDRAAAQREIAEANKLQETLTKVTERLAKSKGNELKIVLLIDQTITGKLQQLVKDRKGNPSRLSLRIDRKLRKLDFKKIKTIQFEDGEPILVATKEAIVEGLLEQVEIRKNKYVKDNGTLSRSEYGQLFKGGCAQQNVGNCYMLAAFGAIPLKHREALMRVSFKRTRNGCLVSFPLGSKEPKSQIEVLTSDIQPQIIVSGNRKASIRPVDSSLGWQLLEARVHSAQAWSR